MNRIIQCLFYIIYEISFIFCCSIIISPPPVWRDIKIQFLEEFFEYLYPLPSFLLLKNEINNYHKIIYIIFSFSLVLLSPSSVQNNLLIVFAQCYPLLFLSYNNFYCCILPFQSLSIFHVLRTNPLGVSKLTCCLLILLK